MKQLNATVFPSNQKTISVAEDKIYGGAHKYEMKNCVGFNNGKTQYIDSAQAIQFVQKNDDGSMIPGLQSEQVVIALLDRHKKLNSRFPSPQNRKMIEGLEMFLTACQERVEERLSRGVMGKLKR